MSIFDTLNGIINAPLDILNTGEDAVKSLISLPDKILQAITEMQIPMLILGGLFLIKEINK